MTSTARSTDPAPTGAQATARVAVWDLPVRLFHWLLVGLIAFSWWTAEEDHLDWHVWSGLAVLTLIVFRLLWGVFGSSTARWSGLFHRPSRSSLTSATAPRGRRSVTRRLAR